jgi:small subunit ribosomal protein S17
MVTTKKTTAKAPAKKAAPAAKRVSAEPTSATETSTDSRNALQKRATMVGLVVSDKMQKTITVKVDRRVRHGLYGKFIVHSRRFKAHDETNQAKMGDRVELVESRPLSREKRWVLKTILRKAGQVLEANI